VYFSLKQKIRQFENCAPGMPHLDCTKSGTPDVPRTKNDRRIDDAITKL
jgi:hypothetical protein